MKLLSLAIIASLLTGCATSAKTPVTSTIATTPMGAVPVEATSIETFYDYQLYTEHGDPISVNALPIALANADVILVGEWHTHPGIHRFQTDLLGALSKSNRSVALSMEQFSRPSQTIINEYLANEIGEQTLMSQANAWPNYESDYRPLVELAKHNQLDIIASNAPKPTVRCIGREGLDYLNKLDANERSYIAKNIDTSDTPYKDKFMRSMHHGSAEQTNKQYAAQLTWDATMAESIVDYLESHPNSQVMHIAGKFHIENGLGTADQIRKLNPNLTIAVISPASELMTADANKSDMQLLVLSPPVRYVKKENRMNAYKNLKVRNDDLQCQTDTIK
ncbi:ChaN family lipoprotein [Vibrio sp. 10N.261.51.F12]|uniref:ChaN family lipoprotein n=1 Tax=Vibrio sp. 10N.261.51.F12 TaxID=3229679 RepID=UPI00354B249A